MSAPAPPPIPLGTTYGVLFMGPLMVVGFWSISVVQTFNYFYRYPNDHPGLKALVASMALLTAAQVGLIISAAWHQLIDQFGDYNGLLNLPKQDLIEFLSQLYLTVAVQGFFVWRIAKLTERTWSIAVPWVLSAIVQVVTGLMWMATAIKDPSLATLLHNKTWIPGAISLCMTAIVDTVLAVAMTILLANRMSQAAYKPSVKTLRRLLVLSINSGTWTAAFAILDIVLYWVYKDNMLYLLFDLPVGSMYLCTILANLNARRSSVREHDDYYVESSGHSSNTARVAQSSNSGAKIPSTMRFVDPYHDSTNNTEMSMFKPEP